MKDETFIRLYVGEEIGDAGFVELEYNPYEGKDGAVIFRSCASGYEIYLEPSCIRKMVDEIKSFADTLDFIRSDKKIPKK